mmetsp:Transcript_9142/g.22413  ORF Transcript_9142/g.22413 Transcript_9142/m.22413 type:complete len:188 (+) Transcript_9142:637-1200(+)
MRFSKCEMERSLRPRRLTNSRNRFCKTAGSSDARASATLSSSSPWTPASSSKPFSCATRLDEAAPAALELKKEAIRICFCRRDGWPTTCCQLRFYTFERKTQVVRVSHFNSLQCGRGSSRRADRKLTGDVGPGRMVERSLQERLLRTRRHFSMKNTAPAPTIGPPEPAQAPFQFARAAFTVRLLQNQ